jgi:hypothetical protein
MPHAEPYETVDLNRDGHAVGPDSTDPGQAPPWSRARAALETTGGPAGTAFLGTVRPDGRPHSAGVGALWHDGDLYFISGPGARKARNLAANPAATLSIATPDMHLVFEGTAARVTDTAVLESVAAAYGAAGWPAEVDGDAFTAPFNAPSAGPSPWHLYRLTFHTAFGLGTSDPTGASRWRFDR